MWFPRGRGVLKSIRNYNVGLLNGPPSCPRPLVFSSNKCFSMKYIIYLNFTGREYTFSEIFSYESTMFSNFLWSGRSLCSLARGKRINENEGMLASEGNIDCCKEDFSTKDANSIKLSESSPLLKLLMDAPNNSSVTDVLEKWIENGNILDRDEASVAILSLHNRWLYGKALQFMEWLEAKKHLNFAEHNYATHLDLVAKVRGIKNAEIFISKIPESLRNGIIYETFLACCVSESNVKKAEEVFNTIRDNGLPITVFSCDQLLLLYSKVDKKKVSDVVKIMEKESIKPSIFTYRILLDLKGQSNDIVGLEQIIEKMKSEKMENDLIIQSMVIKFYIQGGYSEKAEVALKCIEGENVNENRDACNELLCLYADFQKSKDVARIWNVCESNPRLGEALSAIEAFGKVGNVGKSEEIFERILKLYEKNSLECYEVLLKVYANHKRLFEFEDLVNQMKKDRIKFRVPILDILVKLYIEFGELEKADNLIANHLITTGENKNYGPLHQCHFYLLKEYSKRGDIENSERLFNKMKQSGFRYKLTLYQLLLEAYLNVKRPVYGFRERMRGDNVFPNSRLSKQLAALDALVETYNQDLELDLDLSTFKTRWSTHDL